MGTLEECDESRVWNAECCDTKSDTLWVIGCLHDPLSSAIRALFSAI